MTYQYRRQRSFDKSLNIELELQDCASFKDEAAVVNLSLEIDRNASLSCTGETPSCNSPSGDPI